MEIAELYQIYQKYPQITTDSRNINKNAIFFALKGENFDGNAFAGMALEKGASFCVIDNPACTINDKCILVKDSMLTLQELAAYHRKVLNTPIIAVTGSNGKTTTKELINCVLNKKYKTVATKGNLNNHIGVPLTLLSITNETELAVVEMGANHPGEIAILCEIAQPNYGIITNVGKDHLEGFGSPEGVIRTKKELYNSLENNNGTVFIHHENKILKGILAKQKKVFYGKSANAECCGLFFHANPFVTLKWHYSQNPAKDQKVEWQDIIETTSNLIGAYNFDNILAAICIGNYFGVDKKLINEAIREYVPVNNRSQFVKTSKNSVFLDAYNANPSSMEVAVQNFAAVDGSNKKLILGDMLELGKYSDEEHLKLFTTVAENKNFDQVFFVGSEFCKIKVQEDSKSRIFQFLSVNDLCEWLKDKSIENSVVLVKGSRGIKLEKVLEFL